jgi:two-component system sensor histidine kinase KdpD
MPEFPARASERIALDLGVALFLMLVAAASAELLHALLGLTRLALLFLGAVTIAAATRGSRGGLFAAIMGVIFYKVFLDLRTADQTGFAEDLLNLLVFLVVAVITGTLAGRLHDQAIRAELRATRMALLLNAGRVMSDDDERSSWDVLAGTLRKACGGAAFVYDRTGSLRAAASDHARTAEADQLLNDLLQREATTVMHRGSFSGRRVLADGNPIATLIWQGGASDTELEDVVELLAELASAAASRTTARHEQVRARAIEEAASLRESLLSSVSHDFRSPLSAIIGSATSLLEYHDKFDETVRNDLLLNIRDEGEKLNGFVTNLLDVGRLEAGVIEPRREPVLIDDVVRTAVERLKRHRGDGLQMHVEGTCVAMADPLLLEQAVYNILDNAAKYAGQTSKVQVTCETAGDHCRLVVADQGPGLVTDEQNTIFEKFAVAPASRGRGTGLGLFIARGFIEANCGSIAAQGRSDGAVGLEMVITLPRVA